MNTRLVLRSHSQMPQRAASTARRKRCSVSSKACWAARARRLWTISSRVSSTPMAKGPKAVISSTASWLGSTSDSRPPWPMATISPPSAAGCTASRTGEPLGARPWAWPSATSAGVIDSASFMVEAWSTPPAPCADNRSPSGEARVWIGATPAGSSLAGSTAATITAGPCGPGMALATNTQSPSAPIQTALPERRAAAVTLRQSAPLAAPLWASTV